MLPLDKQFWFELGRRKKLAPIEISRTIDAPFKKVEVKCKFVENNV